MNLRRLVTIVVACLAVAGLGFVLFELGLALVTPQHRRRADHGAAVVGAVRPLPLQMHARETLASLVGPVGP